MQDLKLIWEETLGKYSNQKTLHTQLWSEIVEAYNSPSRYYHNLVHIHTMITLAGKHKDSIENIQAFYLAIFYHDIIYDASRSDNELQSWIYAENHLKNIPIPPNEMTLIRIYILATKSHELHDNKDVNLLLDLDLFTLGKSWNDYLNYTEEIRQEYSIYPDKLYYNGRFNVLTHFLNSGNIFKTKVFYDAFETQARLNLTTERDYLQSKINEL